MSRPTLPRRRFLERIGIGGAALPLVATADAFAHACECPSGPGDPGGGDPIADAVKVRRDVYSLDPDGPEIAGLRAGIGEMLSRPVTDPTSWLFQANIHGTPDAPPPGLPAGALATWSTCEHSSYFFLSWHRMYLYFFERILRAASGDPNLALPYWNYEPPSQRALPLAYRQPASANNPLFVAARRTFGPNINAGEPVSALAVSPVEALATTFFGSPTQFGFTWALESRPHNVMHVEIGGGGGWMSDPRLAARDPIFWAHHANIDRLWSRWKAQGAGREDPVNDTAWAGTLFPFYDETGGRVEMTGAEVLDTADQLEYRYDDEPAPLPGLVVSGGGGLEAAAGAAELARLPQGATATLGATRVNVPLGVTVEAGAEAFRTAPRPGARPVVLEIGMVDYKSPPGLWYEVYVNLPDAEPADPKGPYFAGTIAFFAQSMSLRREMRMKGEHQPERLDVTGVLNRQLESNRWGGGDVSVSFVPRGNENPAIEAVTTDRQVTIGSIRVVRQ